MDTIIETSTPIPTESSPALPRASDTWLNAWLRANAYFPLSHVVITPTVTKSVVDSIIDGKSSWADFQQYWPNDSQVEQINQRVVKVYKSHGLDNVPSSTRLIALWNAVKEEVKPTIQKNLRALGVDVDPTDEFFTDIKNKEAIHYLRRLLDVTVKATMSEEGRNLAKDQRSQRFGNSEEVSLNQAYMTNVIHSTITAELKNISGETGGRFGGQK